MAIAAAHWPTAAYAACGASTGAGNGPPSISATEVSTAQALQILRRRQDEAVAANAGGGGGNVAVASLSPPPPPPPAPAPQAAAPKPPAPKPVAAKPTPPPAPKVAAKPAPVTPKAEPTPPAAAAKPAPKAEALPEVKAEPKVEAQPEVKAEPKKPDTTYLPKAAGKLVKPAPVAVADEAPVQPKKKVAKTVVKKPAKSEKTVVAYAAPKAKSTGYPEAVTYRGGSMKDDYVPAAAPAPTRGVWAQGYYDYERQGGWTLDGGTPGELTSKERTVGMLAGGDVSIRAPGQDSVLLLGAMGGYSNTTTKYNDVSFKHTDGTTFDRTNARDDLEGGSFGLYGVYASQTWTADMLVKFDFLGLDQKDIVQQQACGDGPLARQNTADVFNVVVAGDVARRYMVSRDAWFEPVVGFRYTHVDYSNIRQLSDLPPLKDFGLSDGDIFRVQGGVRVGMAHQLSADHLLVTTVGGFLYSDVAISGISKDYRDVQEGKLRAMGQLTTALSDRSGMTYMMQLEVRGGEDLIGFGAKGGVRYEW